jgi:hypothetical protein
MYSRSSQYSCLWEGLSEGWLSREQLEGDTSWRPFLYLYANTTYEQMKSHWATCDPPDAFCIGPETIDEFAQYIQDGQENGENYQPYYPSAWPRERAGRGDVVPYIRPATPKDLTKKINPA